MKQLALLREKALKTFKATIGSGEGGTNEFEAMLQV